MPYVFTHKNVRAYTHTHAHAQSRIPNRTHTHLRAAACVLAPVCVYVKMLHALVVMSLSLYGRCCCRRRRSRRRCCRRRAAHRRRRRRRCGCCCCWDTVSSEMFFSHSIGMRLRQVIGAHRANNTTIIPPPPPPPPPAQPPNNTNNNREHICAMFVRVCTHQQLIHPSHALWLCVCLCCAVVRAVCVCITRDAQLFEPNLAIRRRVRSHTHTHMCVPNTQIGRTRETRRDENVASGVDSESPGARKMYGNLVAAFRGALAARCHSAT